MCSLKILPVVLVLSTLALATTALQLTSADDVAAKIVAHEQAEVQLLRQYTPLVETYIQYLRADTQAGSVPHGDKYFLGRAELAQRTGLELLDRTIGMNQKLFRGLGEFFSMEFVPRGFLQMIYVDGDGFDRNHYRFEYARREFLGDVRCLVFYIDPLTKSGKGRFVSRIWVEDRDYHIVRINGAYGGSSLVSNYFNFDSWRINAGNNLWLPAFIYSEEGSVNEVLETVINNIEVTNGLNIQPEDRCRVLMTSTLESLTMGHTIVLSRRKLGWRPSSRMRLGTSCSDIAWIASSGSLTTCASMERRRSATLTWAAHRKRNAPPAGRGPNCLRTHRTANLKAQHSSFFKRSRTDRSRSPILSVRTWATGWKRAGLRRPRNSPRSPMRRHQSA